MFEAPCTWNIEIRHLLESFTSQKVFSNYILPHLGSVVQKCNCFTCFRLLHVYYMSDLRYTLNISHLVSHTNLNPRFVRFSQIFPSSLK